MVNVFISYAHRDADIAARVSDALKEQGIDVFMDRVDIAPGDSWHGAVIELMQKADSVLILLSPSALNSAYIAREYQYALSQGEKPLYVAFIAPVPADEIPYPLRDLHYIDLTRDFEENIAKLSQMIKSQQPPQGIKRLYQSAVDADEKAQVTLEANLKQDNIDDILEQVKKSLESGARSVKVVNVDDE